MPFNLAAQVMDGNGVLDASNPASGVHNVMLQPGTGAEVGNMTSAPDAMSAGGVKPEEAIRVLNEVIAAGTNAQSLTRKVEDLYTRSTNEYFKGRFQTVLQAMHMSNDPRTQTKDPQTGKKDPTAAQLSQELIQEIQEMSNQEKQQQKAQASSKVFNLKEAAGAKKKKKHGGNPFKVLMGQVGKLLDHGVPTRDIIRHLKKNGYWNEETIYKAVNIVKDYNRKKHKSDANIDESEEKQEKKHDVQNDSMMVANSSFNLRKFAQTSIESDGVYGVTPDWSKRSTGELIMHASYLADLLDYGKNTKQGDGKEAASKKGASSRLKEIKSELKTRGFDETELEKNVFRGIQ